MDMQWICNGYAMDMQWICNGYAMDMDVLFFSFVFSDVSLSY